MTSTYDVGDRLTQLVDSLAGTNTRTSDGLDWLLAETTPQGTVSYSYDLAGRRTSMTVTGQPTGTYTYGLAAQKGNGLSCPSQILGRPSIIITRAQN